MVAMAKSASRSLAFNLSRWRAWVQGAFLLVWLDPLLLRMHTVCGPVFHCYSCPLALFACPIGVVANFGALHLFPLLAVGTLLVVGSLVGGFICGWVCPFGLLQDLIAKIPTPKLKLPSWTGYVRYVVLVGAVLAVPFFLGKDHPLFVCAFCPVGAIEGAVPNMVRQAAAGDPVVWPNLVKTTIVVLLVVAMFVTSRPWCRLFCPLGAVYGLFNRVSVLFLRLDPQLCTHCERCRKVCRYGVTPDRFQNDSRCIRCLECTQCRALGVGSVFGRAPKPASEAETTDT